MRGTVLDKITQNSNDPAYYTIIRMQNLSYNLDL
jgi:hypothetical protein